MTFVALIISLFVAGLGALGIASPARLIAVMRSFQAPAGLYAAAALRVVLGTALVFTAPTSRAPEFIRVLGFFIVVVGLITPFFGVERFKKLVDWWLARGPAFIRAWAAFALVGGLLLAYAIVP